MSNPYEGDSTNPLVPGIKGTNTTGTGVFGSGSCGVHGVNGNGANNPPPVGPGLWGESEFGYGVYAACVNNNGIHGDSTNGDAVVGVAHAQGKSGVLGISNGAFGAGVTGMSSISHGVHGVNGKGANNPPPVGTGVWGESEFGYGVYGASNNGWAGYFEGKVQVTGDIVMPAADFAEDFAVEGSDVVEPGTVMVLDDNGVLRASDKSYDKKVAGVISGAGDYRPGLILDRHESSAGRLPVALVGKVYCKADATFGAIEVGDLLTTSSTPGHAMKAADPLRAFGAVIGKAMRPLESSRGLVPILIALQ